MLVEQTCEFTRKEAGNPDHVGKNRMHWANLYMQMYVRVLPGTLQGRDKSPRLQRRK
jgi:hypothetical protein